MDVANLLETYFVISDNFFRIPTSVLQAVVSEKTSNRGMITVNLHQGKKL